MFGWTIGANTKGKRGKLGWSPTESKPAGRLMSGFRLQVALYLAVSPSPRVLIPFKLAASTQQPSKAYGARPCFDGHGSGTA